VLIWTGDPPGSRLALRRATASGGFGLEPAGSPVLGICMRSVGDRARIEARSISSQRNDWGPTPGDVRS
jgi:hypothetical protein